MHGIERPLSEPLPRDLPWRGTVALLLDGVSVDKLPQQLYTWSEAPDYQPLYLGTRWSGLTDISPCLVRLNSERDPICQQFLAHADEEWGYLVFSDQPWQTVLDHFRWLICVTHPQGQQVLLRLADPAVAHALLDQSMQRGDATLFGPCSHVLTADAALRCWHNHRRPAKAPVTSHVEPYRLSESQVTLLDEVNFRSVVIRLDRHMREYFPAFQVHLDALDRWKYLYTLASNAYERGFGSELEITLYANIHGFLGPHAMTEHPDLDTLLETPSTLSPTQRIEHVASIAKERAESLQGSHG
ncbi:DUF4123 domain-containing protein [Pseudomonas viridiflava]|uniref:DUF4123 domain-containing protein n=1 Tax=Pseudomonas viridiflava TaxID=33069 RepID=UPI000F020072|nr:DUF4123 domain-containing protein [Pseudomonas viridiflava]MEE4156847.1 DUF4123 domain-containing protein [Pseudomonas viridiflava]